MQIVGFPTRRLIYVMMCSIGQLKLCQSLVITHRFGFSDSLTAVSMMVDQIMELHPAVQYFHIGADEVIYYEPRHEETRSYAKTKTQISCAVTAQLISAFVFAMQIVQYLFFLNPKFQASSHLLRLYRLVCVRPGGKHILLVFSCKDSLKV